MGLDHEAAGTTFDADSRTRTEQTWKGNHKGCGGHRGGICVARDAWMNGAEATVHPVIISKSIEKRARVQFEYEGPGSDLKEPEFLSAHKGWLPAADAKGVKPSREILDALLATAERELGYSQEQSRVPYSEAQKQLADFRAQFAKNNGLEAEKPARKAG